MPSAVELTGPSISRRRRAGRYGVTLGARNPRPLLEATVHFAVELNVLSANQSGTLRVELSPNRGSVHGPPQAPAIRRFESGKRAVAEAISHVVRSCGRWDERSKSKCVPARSSLSAPSCRRCTAQGAASTEAHRCPDVREGALGSGRFPTDFIRFFPFFLFFKGAYACERCRHRNTSPSRLAQRWDGHPGNDFVSNRRLHRDGELVPGQLGIHLFAQRSPAMW